MNNALMQYNPTPIEPAWVAQQRAAQMQGAQRNALMQQMQYEDALQQRQAQQQQAQQNALMQQVRQRELGAMNSGAGPAMPFDAMRLLSTGAFKPEEVKQFAEAPNWGRSKVARTITRAGKDGRPETVQVDEFGREVGAAMPDAVKLQLENMGGSSVAVDPYSMTPGQQFKRTQSPDSVASTGVAMRGQNMTDARARESLAQQERLAGTKVVAASEDERKAAGWLAQATNAWENMRKVGFDSNGNVKPAAKPGFNDALAAVPSFGLTGGLANLMRTPDRQKFMQASSSLSEALLRAATGAGVNESEARQKIQELTPVFGEDEETTRQKMDAVPMYLNALKDRAGRAAPAGYKPPQVPGQRAPSLPMPADPNAAVLFDAADAILRGGK